MINIPILGLITSKFLKCWYFSICRRNESFLDNILMFSGAIYVTFKLKRYSLKVLNWLLLFCFDVPFIGFELLFVSISLKAKCVLNQTSLSVLSAFVCQQQLSENINPSLRKATLFFSHSLISQTSSYMYLYGFGQFFFIIIKSSKTYNCIHSHI